MLLDRGCIFRALLWKDLNLKLCHEWNLKLPRMAMNDELLKMSVAKNLKVHSVLHQMQRYDTSFVLQLINNPMILMDQMIV